MANKKNSTILLLQQVEDLEKRTKSAIEAGDNALTFSLTMEYGKLIVSALGKTQDSKELFREIIMLKTESATIPPYSKDDPLAQLRWLDNSISKLKLIVKRLSPVGVSLEPQLHPRVLAVSGKLLRDKHYSQAVFEAFKALEEYVREKSGRDEYGEYLMSKVFNEDNPILKIKYSRPDTAKDEQKGFKFIFMGVMTGIRNPKGHHTIVQRDRARALQYLALASLLFKTVDDATLT